MQFQIISDEFNMSKVFLRLYMYIIYRLTFTVIKYLDIWWFLYIYI